MDGLVNGVESLGHPIEVKYVSDEAAACSSSAQPRIKPDATDAESSIKIRQKWMLPKFAKTKLNQERLFS